PFPCPPDGPELGRSTWSFLHTMAAYYPPQPTPTDRTMMSGFVDALARFYPCGHCAEHLRNVVKERPPDTSSPRALSRWFCEVHNEVNVMNGKEEFDCEKVFERWRDGGK
ncbi:ERV/ALR sulfhydryl oxidase domain-containing protein, partial [Blyttiomyces helicus]